MRIGFVETGTMGNPMARCLIDAGHPVTVHDLRREATADLCDLGARWAESPRAAAADSDVVFTSLPGPAQVEQAVLDPSTGILAGLKPGAGYIDLTTNAPGVVRRIAEACRARGVAMLDAPVSGRPPGMTMMVGGEATAFATYRPLLAAMGRNIFHVGDTGTGCVAKLVTQYLGYTNLITSLEGEPDLRQHSAVGPQRDVHRRRDARHRRQGRASRLRARPRGGGARAHRSDRRRRISARTGPGLGTARLSRRRPHPGSDGRRGAARGGEPRGTPVVINVRFLEPGTMEEMVFAQDIVDVRENA